MRFEKHVILILQYCTANCVEDTCHIEVRQQKPVSKILNNIPH